METQLFFIRHAQSQLNIASHNFRVQRNLPYIWSELCKYDEFIKGVKYNFDFIDCHITQKGVQQCLAAKQQLTNFMPDAILVSPLQRTLQTCSHIFGEKQGIPIFVEPLLAEAFRSSCDIPHTIHSKIERYPKYNFESVLRVGDLWCLENQCEEDRKKYYQYLEDQKVETFQQKQKAMWKFMSDTFIFEKPQHVRLRVNQAKKMIAKYHEKYQKIAVVSHYNTINFIVAQKFDENHQPLNSLQVSNCEIVKTSIQQICKNN